MSDTRTRNEALLSHNEAARWLKMHRATLYKRPIPYVMDGGRRKYRPEDLQLYAALNLNRPPLRRAS